MGVFSGILKDIGSEELNFKRFVEMFLFLLKFHFLWVNISEMTPNIPQIH